MADKNVNVNINYNVRTNGVKQSEAQVTKAKTATDKLNNSTKQYGSESKKAGDTASKSFGNVNKNLSDLGNSFTSLSGKVKTFLGLLAANEIIRTVNNLDQMQGRLQGVERAFNRLPNAARVLDEIRTRTRGTVTDLQLMQTAIKAQNFNIPLTELGNLLEFASVKAQQTGESVDYLVDSIITGIGRESVLILDNLQLSAEEIRKTMRDLGVTMGEAVGIIANRELEKMGGLIDTSVIETDRLSAAWQNFQTKILNPDTNRFLSAIKATLTGILETLTPGDITLLSEDQKDTIDGISQSIEMAINESNRLKNEAPLTKAFEDLEDEIKKAQETGSKLWSDFIDASGNVNKSIARTTNILPGLRGLIGDGGKAELELARNASKANDEYIQRLNILMDQLKTQAEILAKQDQGQKRPGVIAQLEAEIKSLNEAVRNAPTVEIAVELQQQLDVATEALNRFKSALNFGPPTVEITKVSDGIKNITYNTKEGFTEVNKFSKDVTSIFEDGTDAAKEMTQFVRELISELNKVEPPKPTIRGTFFDDLKEQVELARDVLLDVGVDIFAEQLAASSQIQVAELQNQLVEVRNYYDKQQQLAGDNKAYMEQLRAEEAQKTKEIQQDIADQQKRANRFSVIIDTAAGIVKAFATLPTPAAIVQSAIIAAIGASQLAIINRTPVPAFAKGVIGLNGPGNGKSDSIHARLSAGESVITAEATAHSRELLGAINARQIDDRVLKDMILSKDGVQYVGMDSKGIIDAINAQKTVDFERIGSVLYKTMEYGNGSRKRVRSKIMGL